MGKYLVDKIIRIRCKKDYTDAHCHVLIGRVVEETSRYLVIKSKAFHFKRIIGCMKNQVDSGDISIRILPWNNIEIIHVLNEKIDYSADCIFDSKGNLVLKDKVKTIIAKQRGNGD